MMADYNVMVEWIDQADHYYRHSFDIGAYFDSFGQVKFGSEPESIGMSKKNQSSYSNAGYMNLKEDY